MGRQELMKKIIAILLILVLVLAIAYQPVNNQANAAINSLSVQAYAKEIAEKIKLASDTTSDSDCISILKDKGIIKEEDFTDYSSKITRGDALVLLNRADDYFNKTKVSSKRVEEVIKKRISDIDKVAESKQEDLARGFLKGLMIGYSNGQYSANRKLKVNNAISIKDAKTCLKLLTDKKHRAKLSPDGQVIRTTKLPNNAKMFSYILASYPNRYYEAELMFEGVTRYRNGKIVPLKSPEDYTYPKDVKKAKDGCITNYNDAKEMYLDTWLNKVYTRVWNTFNVNYKTINNNWVETMAKTDSFFYDGSDVLYEALNRYVKEMKGNKTVVKCNKVALDSSSIYYYNGIYYVRCYVHYRILSSKIRKSNYFDGKLWGPYNKILFSRASYVNLDGFRLNKWYAGVFDVGIAAGEENDDGSLYGVCDCEWSPAMFRVIERK